jgi:phosphoribosylanthranilate isomerase
MPVRIKVCGITNWEDARVAVSLGVDALGFIFSSASPRFVPADDAARIIRRLPPFVNRVGVFVDEPAATVHDVIRRTGIDTVQLHGSETPEYCRQFGCAVVKAFRVAGRESVADMAAYQVNAYLLDTWDATTAGGSGRPFDWAIAAEACRTYPTVILAGGLGPTNIREALDIAQPWGVDVNSGVEVKPGVKNPRKVHEVVRIVRGWKQE